MDSYFVAQISYSYPFPALNLYYPTRFSPSHQGFIGMEWMEYI